MKKGWQTKKLGEVCSFLNRGVSPKYVEKGGIAVLNQRCVRDHVVSFEVGRRHDVKAKSVSDERLLRAGDVLVNSTGTGTLGRVAQLREDPPEPTTVDSHVTIVRPSPGQFFPEFFGYVLRDIEDELKESGEGCGGQTELNRSVLAEKFEVRFPQSLAEQQRIVGLLDEAFANIAIAKANAEQNLKNARAIFDSYLNEVFTKKGDGWVETTLDKISTNLDSKRVPITKDVRTSGEYPYYGASGIVDYVGDYIFEGDNLLVSEDGANLLARTAPIAFSVSGRYWVNNHAHVLHFENMATQRFVEFYLESTKLDDYITGAAQPKLNQKALYSIPIPIPKSLETQAKMVESVVLLRQKVQSLMSLHSRKIAALEELKKALLHRAFNGDL